MIILSDIIIILLLVIVSYQDIRSREVSWFLFPLLFIAIVYKGLIWMETLKYTLGFLLNLLCVIIQLAALLAFYAIRHGSIKNFLTTRLGTGDILFLIILSAGMAPIIFEIFLVVALALVLISVFTIKFSVTYWNKKTIPLAGLLSIFYQLFILSSYIVPSVNPYNVYFEGGFIIGY